MSLLKLFFCFFLDFYAKILFEIVALRETEIELCAVVVLDYSEITLRVVGWNKICSATVVWNTSTNSAKSLRTITNTSSMIK